MSFEDITAVIPVRLGSTRIKHKVLLPFNYNGKTVSLLELKILQLKEVLNPENILVSCGESALAEIALAHNCKVSWRDEKFITSNYQTSTEETIREVIKDVKTKHTAWATAVSPLHSGDIFSKSFDFYLNKMPSKYDSLLTICEQYHYFWFKNNPVNYFPDNRHVQSQLLSPLKKVTNGLYLCPTLLMRKAGYFLGSNPYLFSVPDKCGIDIDTEFDYQQALFFDKWNQNEDN